MELHPVKTSPKKRTSNNTNALFNELKKDLEKEVSEWHKVSDGDLPRQDGNTCFSIKVLASNKKWVYYAFGSGKWFCGNKEVKVVAWKEIVFPSKEDIV